VKVHLQLKSEQKEIIQNVLERKDSMAVLPTGFGKSMCYVSPSHFGQGKIIYANHLPRYIAVIVVSPTAFFSELLEPWDVRELYIRKKLICPCNSAFAHFHVSWLSDFIFYPKPLYKSVCRAL
jgi:hypothetical protein